MKSRISWGRVLRAGLVAGLVLIVAEAVVEGLLIAKLLGLGIERDGLAALGASRADWGIANHLLNLALPFVAGVLLVALYAAIRPRFGAGPQTALLAAGLLLAYWTTVLAFMTNYGVLTMAQAAASFLDNLVVLPVATLAGARFYRE